MKKVLSIILAAVMMLCVLPISGFAADYTPATGYAAYDSDKIAASDAEYIASLSVDQIAGIILDYVDAYLADVDVNINYEGFEISTLDMLDVNSLTSWAYDAINGDLLGGDFDKLDAAALKGLSRDGGDVNYIYGIISFIAANADIFGKVFSWDNADETFDCGKIGEYLETLNEGDEGYDARVFYEKYILSNDIKAAFTSEIAREMGYTIPEGETFDETISNGIINWVADLLNNAGLLSDAGVKTLKAYDLRTEDIYYHLKNLVALLQSDNAIAEKTYFTYYLDSVIRTVLKTALGFSPVVGEDSDKAVAEFKATYKDLATLYAISGGTVNYRATDGSYYQFVIAADGTIASAKALTWENTLGFDFELPVVDIFTGANDKLVKEYKPTSTNVEDYTPTIYTAYAAQIPDEMKEGINVSADAVPEEYTNIISTADAIAMQDYLKVFVKQGDETKLDTTISFAEVEAYAEAEALKMAQETVAGISLPFGLTVAVDSVDIALEYTGYATDDEFVCVINANASVVLSGTAASMAQSAADSAVASMLNNPIATVVMDNLSGSDTDIAGLVDLANFIDTDFAVDMGVIDFAGNYDKYNGVFGQVNRVLCDLLDMLLSDEGYEDLALTEGGNENLTANLEKLCDKAEALIGAAKQVISGEEFNALVESMNISDLFASSHGFNADMIYNLDFSSVENLYVCAIRLGCDFLDDETEGVLHDIHMLVEDLGTLDAMAVAVTDYALAKAIDKANASIDGFNYTYTSVGTVADDVNAKDVIMSKLVDVAYYAVNDWGTTKVNAIINDCIAKLNAKLDEDLLPTISFKFDVQKGANWEATLNNIVNRVLDLTDGIITVSADINRNANVFDKISALANAVLPIGSFFSNCKSNGYAVDIKHIVNDIIFTDALSGDMDDLLGLAETATKTEDVAKGVGVPYALIKALDKAVDAILPGTVAAENYKNSLTVFDSFMSSDNLQVVGARAIKALDNVKTDLVPAVLSLLKESGALSQVVFADCAHANTVDVVAIPATCILTGYTAGVRCKDCGKWISGHEATTENAIHVGPIDDIEKVDATCTADGHTAGKKCTACNTVISGNEVIKATGHHYGEWKVEKDSTCTKAGVEARTCACGNKETRAIALKTHTPMTVPGYAATCTESGKTEGTVCSVCGTTINAQQTIPATGHTDADGDNACDTCGATIKEPSFLDRIKAFFQNIINWFKNLFK